MTNDSIYKKNASGRAEITLTIIIPKELRNVFKKAAMDRNMTLKSWVVMACKDALDKDIQE